MTIQFYLPQRLRGLVFGIWEHTSHEAVRWTILPSGKVELMFRIGPVPDLVKAKKIDSGENPMKHFAFMSGLQTKPLSMVMENMHFIGVQMTPIAFKAFFGIPLSSITDYYLPGTEFLNALTEIEDKLNGPKDSFYTKAEWLENFLYSRIIETSELHMAMALLDKSKAFIQPYPLKSDSSIESLMGYSRTHTFRIFKEWFGIAPHQYQRLNQFVSTVSALHQNNSFLTETGLEAGYFDQSHFIRSFKSFSGITPGEYLKRMTHIPGQISG